MTFIITLISLVIERFFDWSHIRQWRWFARYLALVNARISGWPVYAQLAACVLPLMLLAELINCIISSWLFGVVKLVFGIVILAYCLGLKNFWAEVYAAIADLHKDDSQAAMDKIQKNLRYCFSS
jgi:Membrane protein required for beta-lactamase induction